MYATSVQTSPLDLRRELIHHAQQATDVADLFAKTAVRLRRLVKYDAAGWFATDPATGLPTAPSHSVNIVGPNIRELCTNHWRREFTVDDVILFRDLARSPRPAGALRATIGDPERSPRYREFIRPLGFSDELRAVLKVGDSPWAILSLLRRSEQPSFTSDEVDVLADLSEPLGEALRLHARPIEALGKVSHDRPGLMIFDAAGDLTSINDQARFWLDALPWQPSMDTPLGVDIPHCLVALVSRTTTNVSARIRLRTRDGGWLVCHGSQLSDATGGGNVAVVIEPANATDIAPIIVQAFDLSNREQQVTRLIANGMSTAEIAGELFLSAHTVRDYIKIIFQKVDVSSRGELVAKLYADYYEPIHSDESAHTSELSA